MNFQQLRSVVETVRRKYNLTAVAETLHTSQPGVSRQIKEIEDELGCELFLRSGKRLLGMTAAGTALLPVIERLLQEAENLKRAGAEYAGRKDGVLTIAATHTQARYALPPAVRDFRQKHPGVALRIRQASPDDVAQLLLRGEADIGVATESLASQRGLVTLPCYQWSHVVVVPNDHPWTAASKASASTRRGSVLTLDTLASHPLITYEPGVAGRRHIDDAFAKQGLVPEIVLDAMDADVIKTYVRLGLGVGIVAAIAIDDEKDTDLHVIDARHLFAHNLTRLALRRGDLLRGYVYDFIELFASPLTRNVVARAMAQSPDAASDDDTI